MKRILLIIIIVSIYSIILSNIPILIAEDLIIKPLWSRGGPKDTISLNNPTGFCIDPSFRYIYVADTGNNRILIFTTNGEFVERFFTSKEIEKPFDIICSRQGDIYVSQMNKAKIDVFNKRGEYVASLPKGEGYDDLRPGRMAFNANGLLFLADRANGEIFIVNNDGRVVKRFSYTDRESLLTGIFIGEKKRIYTTWAQGIPVRVFNEGGEVFFSFGHHRQIESGFSFPSSITIDKRGNIWVVDAFRSKVKIFSSEGEYLYQTDVKDLIFPVDIEFDNKGLVYLLEKGIGRIRAFTKESKNDDLL